MTDRTNPTPPRDDAPVLNDLSTAALLKAQYAQGFADGRADQPARVVKPLVWENTRIGVYPFDVEAKTSIGTYNAWSFCIKGKNGSEEWVHGWNRPSGIDLTECASFEAAKAAAQADYERRILAALLPTEAGAEPVASRVYVGGEASVAVCSFCDISGCHHIRATNTTPPAAQVTEALVERAFKAGLAYASICDVTDPDEAWRISNIRAAALRALAGEK